MIDIKSNYHWHDFLHGYELTDKQRAEFDYIEDIDTHHFIKYKGMIIDVHEFMVIDHNQACLPEEFRGWDGYQSDSYFSGLLITYSQDSYQYQIATYIS